jgi:hypothetical protein
MGWWARNFGGIKSEPALLDHVPVSSSFVDADGNRCIEEKRPALGEGLSHREKLALAAKRMGAPFKCAADDVPHVINRVDGTTIDTGELVVDVAVAWDLAKDEDAARRRVASTNIRPIGRTAR